MDVPWLSLVLQIDPTADPVAGTVGQRAGSTQAFTGWTQLGHVLDTEIRSARASATADPELRATAIEQSPSTGENP